MRALCGRRKKWGLGIQTQIFVHYCIIANMLVCTHLVTSGVWLTSPCRGRWSAPALAAVEGESMGRTSLSILSLRNCFRCDAESDLGSASAASWEHGERDKSAGLGTRNKLHVRFAETQRVQATARRVYGRARRRIEHKAAHVWGRRLSNGIR